MEVNVEKTVPVSYKEVVDAYAVVRQGGKASGIDNESWKVSSTTTHTDTDRDETHIKPSKRSYGIPVNTIG